MMQVTIDLTDAEVRELERYLQFTIMMVRTGMDIAKPIDHLLGRLWDAIPEEVKRRKQ
jgi:hypothetical protein